MWAYHIHRYISNRLAERQQPNALARVVLAICGMETKSLFAKALIAEHNYSQELERVYGTDACNARYDRKRNEATPELARLSKVWLDKVQDLLDDRRRAKVKPGGMKVN